MGFQFSAPTRSYADSYQVFNLGNSGGVFFQGMDDAGHVALTNNSLYFNFLNGVSTGPATTTVPSFTLDNGTPCTPSVPTGGSVQHGVCNNGLDAFTGFLSPSQFHPNIYVGQSFLDIFNGGGGFIFMNSLGDIVFEDDFSENWYYAAPVPTPEPSSLILLVTGIAAGAGLVRRKLLP
ncbi:MAG TPA: PEP-CTERM sorting domain-containing protein [Acidobacteriaceae bacterium]|jgi:hypothetical protein|nr:PEP-CTERM sorting domain-containing protein [Acidobacteriaceae bacterium]